MPLKTDSLFKKADELGAEYIATGHHAKITQNEGKYNVEKAEQMRSMRENRKEINTALNDNAFARKRKKS